MPESQMNFREETGYWVTKGPRCNGMRRNPTFLQKKSLDEQNAFSGKVLLNDPNISLSRTMCTAHGFTKPENKEPVICQRIHLKEPVESSQCATTKRFSNDVSPSNPVGNWETEDLNNSEVKFNHSLMHNNCNCKKGPRTSEEDSSRLYNEESIWDLHHCKNAGEARKARYKNQHITSHSSNSLNAYPVSSVHEQQNVQCEPEVRLPARGIFQRECEMKIQRRSHKLGRSFCGAVYNQPFSGYQVHQQEWIPVCRNKKTDNAGFSSVINNTLPSHPSIYCKSFSGSGVHEKKWVPVQVAERTGSAVVCNVFSDTSPSSCGEMNDRNSIEKIHPDCGSATTSCSRSIEHKALQPTKMSSNDNEVPMFENKTGIAEAYASESTTVSMIYFEGPRGTCQPFIGSLVAAETLDAAYRLQLESERAQLEWGQPLAEFERFLHAASPVISSSHRCAPCAVCSVSQLSSIFLCKHHTDNSISLRALWNWYEKPGNYGLEVKAAYYNNQKGMPTEMTPFQAHFIPFLSAIQLFGKVRPEKQEDELNSSPAKTLPVKYSQKTIQPCQFWVRDKTSEANLEFDEEVCIPNNASQNETEDSKGFLSLADSEVMFEFFESELPHERKPFHIKIAELVNTGTSNLAVGGPSILESLDLHDLHPASWYSVAWYPIYCIPEANFHASFLTYHSLGHLVQRCVPADSHQKKATCIVVPVLGLESYNTQGECWFDPRISDKTSLKEFSQCKSSDLLVKRLRALEENASSFARGCVYKNNDKVFNQQSDYEFFISRRH